MTTTTQPIRVGHSPDPDDAFMFHALANDKIDTGDYKFSHELVDIETLNRRAFSGDLELTAVSLHAYAHLADKYMICNCGASMGDRYGPMVVTPERCDVADLTDKTIAVPGTLTTAFLTLSMWRRRIFSLREFQTSSPPAVTCSPFTSSFAASARIRSPASGMPPTGSR